MSAGGPIKDIRLILEHQRELFGEANLPAETLLPVGTGQVQAGFAPIAHQVPVPAAPKASLKPEPSAMPEVVSLTELYNATCNCQECPLGATRKNYVFGTGSSSARVMVIGEGPGAEEDERGEPFVGRAGQLLTDILKAILFTREEVYIANIVKCRPPGNRVPHPAEIEKCLPYLYKQIELIKPTHILLLGATAANTILKTKEALGKLRGKTYTVGNAVCVVTYHPAALLRNPNWKRDCWEDVQMFRKHYDEYSAG